MIQPYRRIATVLATAAGACAIAVPAAAGLSNNPTFSEHIRVPVPTAAHRVSFDHGTVREAGDDHGGLTRHATRHAEPGDDHGHDHGGATRHAEPGDDHGDDHGGATRHAEPGDDHGHDHGHGGHGHDDHGHGEH